MAYSRRRVLGLAASSLLAAWGLGSYYRRDAVAVTDQYALLDDETPIIDLGVLVANEASVRATATARLSVELPDGTTRSTTETVKPFGDGTDQAVASFRFPEQSRADLSAATARFAVTDCHRFGVVPPVDVGCSEGVVSTDVEA